MSPDSELHEPRARPRRADGARNRAAILVAATRLFGERGTEAPLDEIARLAGVANATLYRHFATRAELLIAVYADEVEDLDALSRRLTDDVDPDRAITEWLRAFTQHVATKRELAEAIPGQPGGERSDLFAMWHGTMRTAAARLVSRAHGADLLQPGLTVDDLLALASGIALGGRSEDQRDAMLALIRDGYRGP